MARARSQSGTFGQHLQIFARSVDIVDNETLADVRNIILEYIRDELDVICFEVTERHWVDNAPGLKTTWSSANRSFSTTIKGADDEYSSQLAVAFDTGQPLWIVNPEREPLQKANDYVDRWCGVTNLPPYNPPLRQRDISTCIVVPMVRPNNNMLGVISLDIGTYLDITEYDREELERIADALGILIDLQNTHDVQSQGTKDAINQLRETKRAVFFPQILKPQIFLAFSAKADEEVVGVLVDVLDQHFSGRLRATLWNEIEESGKITDQILEEITRSRFGICYLSEPQDNTGSFADNPNVLFEAGIMQALKFVSTKQEQAGWIPVREEKSPPAPFDLAGERIEVVPRGDGDRLNKPLFRTRLRGRLENLLRG